MNPFALAHLAASVAGKNAFYAVMDNLPLSEQSSDAAWNTAKAAYNESYSAEYARMLQTV